ncbi:MAG: HNH endonuclease [Propylenella sp.]
MSNEFFSFSVRSLPHRQNRMAASNVKWRLLAVERQHGRCCYCECPLFEQRSTDLASFALRHGLSHRQGMRFLSTAEHLRPKSEGGKNGPGNIAAACRYCNIMRHRRRKAFSFQEYRAYVRRRVSRGKWHPRWVHDAILRIGIGAGASGNSTPGHLA